MHVSAILPGLVMARKSAAFRPVKGLGHDEGHSSAAAQPVRRISPNNGLEGMTSSCSAFSDRDRNYPARRVLIV